MRPVATGAALFLALLGGEVSLQAREPGPSKNARFSIVGSVTISKDPVSPDVQPIPITFDARFVIRLKIEKIVSGASPWKVGTEQVFLIHSPARMFGGYDVRAKRFRFTFQTRPGPASERDCQYCVIELKEVRQE